MRRATSLGMIWLAVAGLAVMTGCRRAAVAELQVAPSELRLDSPRFAPIVFTWRIVAAAPHVVAPTVFVHLRDDNGAVLRTFDHEFPAPWRVGETVRDQVLLYQSALGPALPAGQYRLTAGLYDASGRWQVTTTGKRVDDGEYLVARVEIGAETSGVPGFSFSDGWLQEEAGSDAQLLASRWLMGSGTLRVSGVSEAGVVWMRLRVPQAAADLPDGAVPGLRVVSGCSESEVGVSGAGTHDVRIALPAGVASDGCEIALEPSASVAVAAGRKPRTVLLEILAWGAAVDKTSPAPVAAP